MTTDNDDSNFGNLFNAEPALSRQEVRAEVMKTLADVAQNSAQTTAGIEHAIEEAASQIPDFKERMPQMQAVLREEKVLGDAVAMAESNPHLQSYLTPLYKLTYRLTESQGHPSQKDSAPTERPQSPRLSGLDDEAMYAGALASQRVNLSAENRKQLIQQLENAGVLDVEF